MYNYPTFSPALKNRREAGQALAGALQGWVNETPVILALPRGGVPVAYEVALALHAPLDLLMVRKIGAPGHEEFAIGAVVDGADPQWVSDPDMLRQFQVPPGWFEAQMASQLKEIERRRAIYAGETAPIPLSGRDVIVVDDGIATGSTARVALMALAKASVARLCLAVPVGPREALDSLRPLVDHLVCPYQPEPFRAVGVHYEDFEQTSDEEVIDLLAQARRQVKE